MQITKKSNFGYFLTLHGPQQQLEDEDCSGVFNSTSSSRFATSFAT